MTYTLLIIMVINLVVTACLLAVIVSVKFGDISPEKWPDPPVQPPGIPRDDGAVERVSNHALDVIRDLFVPTGNGVESGGNGGRSVPTDTPQGVGQRIPEIYEGDPIAVPNNYDPTDLTIPDMAPAPRHRNVGWLPPGGGIPGIGTAPDMTGENYVDGEDLRGY